jgi:hypothetical protein
MFNAYNVALVLHSWIRWAALVLGVAATLASLTDRGASSHADRWGFWFITVLDIQMLLGLTLYFLLSPVTAKALSDFPAAMHVDSLRFFAVDHAATMFLALAIAHVGRVLGRKARSPHSKRLRQSVCFGIATLAMIAAIPWPGMANGRPLFRL